MPAYQDPDDRLVVTFKHQALPDEAKSLAEGRPIFVDREICEIRVPGGGDVKVFHANEFARWVIDANSGQQYQQTYAERFQRQYQQFKAHAAQTKSGTPIEYVAFLSAARRAELKAQNVYTLESLADIEGAELKNLGPGGREMKNQAMALIAHGKASAPDLQLKNEIEALRARNAILEGDAEIRAKRPENQFEAMSDEQLREYIFTNTGQAPQGNNSHKTLVRMATEARPDKAA